MPADAARPAKPNTTPLACRVEGPDAASAVLQDSPCSRRNVLAEGAVQATGRAFLLDDEVLGLD